MADAPTVSEAELALLVTLRHLDRSRVEPEVVLGVRTGLAEQIEQMGIPVTVTALPKRSGGTMFGWWRSVAQLTAVAHRFRPDILHANDVASSQALSVVGARYRAPRLIHIRWGITAHAAAWWAHGGAEGVLCTSQWVRRQLGDLTGTSLAPAWVQVLPDAVDWPAEPSAEPKASPPDRRRADRPQIGFIGALAEDHGLETVVEALGLMRAEDRPVLLIAATDNSTADDPRVRLEQLALRDGVDDCVAWQTSPIDVERFYQRVDAVVCPWGAAPAGMVPLEASRFAVPAFADRAGSLPEIIEHNKTGVLVKPTAEAWAKALRQVQIDAWIGQLGRHAQERTRRDHAPQLYQRRLMSAYHRAVASRR